MYDTLHFYLDRPDNTTSLEDLLHGAKHIVNENGQLYSINGKHKNLNIGIYNNSISIRGSLAKFYFPDNSYTLKRADVKRAIQKLSDELSISIDKARVTRIDVSTNFIMKHPISMYYPLLGDCRYFDRQVIKDDTLYYNPKSKEELKRMIFYNKARELDSRNGVTPDVLKDVNLLRYEYRWERRVSKQFKQDVIGSTLYDEAFYSGIIDKWAKAYLSINKMQQSKAHDLGIMKNPTQALEYLFTWLYNQADQTEIQNIINSLKFEDRKNTTRLKKRIKDITSKKEITAKIDLIKELDNEIKNVLMYKR